MTLAALDTAAVARALSLVATRADDLADAYFEQRTQAELPPAEASGAGARVWRESGLAVRLVRGDSTWLASRDALDAAALADALRSVARSVPPAFPAPAEAAAAAPEAPPFDALAAFTGRLERALRRRYVAFPCRVATRWHARDVRVVTPRTASEIERERFFSVDVHTPWGPVGALVPELDEIAAEALAERLAARFRARAAASPPAGHPPLLLRPGATAVALHECVAHSLEADLLSRSGSPHAADGVALGPETLDVLDDPAAAPAAVARHADDEGSATVRRWLLRRGRVAQPIADLAAVRRWSDLLPGSGFRADRHAPPLPRSRHLELLAGGATDEALREAAEGGLEIAEITSGRLDPATGRFDLVVPFARRLRHGEAGEAVGPFRVRGHLASLLGGIRAVGERREAAGAGWCAKAAQRQAVWATAPAIVVHGLEVTP